MTRHDARREGDAQMAARDYNDRKGIVHEVQSKRCSVNILIKGDVVSRHAVDGCANIDGEGGLFIFLVLLLHCSAARTS